MMLSKALDEILGPHSKISVLRVLFTQDELSGREIARRAGLSPRAASLALTQLVKAGILRKHSVGSTHQFAVSRKRYLVSAALGNLFQKEELLASTMGHRIMQSIGRDKCVTVAIFGSFARGEASAKSDFDVLVLLDDSYRIPKVKATLQAGAAKFYDLFGVQLSPYVIGAAEFADRLKTGDKLMKAMVREARVISGKPLSEVLLNESEEKKH
jgi:predicted nucleotidyltransferase